MPESLGSLCPSYRAFPSPNPGDGWGLDPKALSPSSPVPCRLFQLSGHGDEPYRMRLELETASGVKNLRPRVFPNIYQTLIEDHAKSVLSGRRLTGENGLRNLELCAASHRSAKNGGKLVRIK